MSGPSPVHAEAAFVAPTMVVIVPRYFRHDARDRRSFRLSGRWVCGLDSRKEMKELEMSSIQYT